MSRLTLGLTILLLITGCASKAPQWLLYSRASYLYGRIEALGEVHCRRPVPPDRAEVCAEAARVQTEVRRVKPLIDAELSKADPDWDKLLPFIDLLLGAVGKAALVP